MQQGEGLGVGVPAGVYADIVRRGLESGALRPYDPVDVSTGHEVAAASSSRQADLTAQLDAFYKDVAAILAPELAVSERTTKPKSSSRKRSRRRDDEDEDAAHSQAVDEEALWQSRVRGEPSFGYRKTF